MKKKGTGIRRIGSVFLAMWLCIALVPMGVFAEELPDAGTQKDGDPVLVQQNADTENIDEDVPAESYEAEGEAAIEEVSDADAEPSEKSYEEDIKTGTPEPATSFTRDGYTLKFNAPIVSNMIPQELKNAAIDHVWIKAGSNKMTVKWNMPKRENYPDNSGIIVLRAGGPGQGKTYSEIKRISFWSIDQIPVWEPADSYADKTASKKNKPYSYAVAAYYNAPDGYTYISKISDWAAGQTTESKLKSVYKASINKKSAKLQYKESATLSVKYAKPKTTYTASGSNKFRWYTDDKSVATVNQKGKVTAQGAGTTYIRCRLVSGNDVKCKIQVVWAYTPSAPKLSVDVASNSSITLKWKSVKHASYYNLYRSNDGLHWEDAVKVKDTSKKVTGLTHNHRYTFYVTAVNDNHGHVKESSNSNVVNQKAVVKRRPTSVSGWPTSKTLTPGTTFKVSLKITSPDNRKASLQMKSGSKWSTKKTVTLPSGAGKVSYTLSFPNDWKSGTTKWRLHIPNSETSEEYTTKTLTIKAGRVYSNPGGYEIQDKITKHGSYYTSPVLVNARSTRSNCVEAMIKTANKYLGDKYVDGKAGGKPGSGIDASGLVIQACYGTGIDLPVNPSNRPKNAVPKLKGLGKLKRVDYQTSKTDPTDHPGVYRGDLIFFNTGSGAGHVAIYLGWDKIIQADPMTGKVDTSTISKMLSRTGWKVDSVRRVLH